MKAGLLTIAALTASAAAQPHHQHRHRRDVVTDVTYVTSNAPAVIVYVDQNGNPVEAPAAAAAPPAPPSYGPPPGPPANHAPPPSPPSYQTPPAPAPAPPAPAPAPPAPAPKPPAPAAKPPAPAPPAPAAKPPAQAPPPPPPSYGSSPPSNGGSGGPGIVYSPYSNTGGCKTQDEVNSDFDKINGYASVRIYGVDCDQVTKVKNAATPKNMTMFVGVFNIDDCAGEVQTIIDAFNGDWSHVAAVSVGNELVNSGTKSVDQVVAAVNQARSLLRGANYQGPVVTVDTFVAIIANPALCQASDFAGANCHAFFDGKVTADNAGNFVKDQAARVAQACGGKRVVITESGWPHQGTANNVAVCTKADQTAAIKSIEASIPAGDLYLLTAFDELWKASKNTANTFNAEQYWGIIGN